MDTYTLLASVVGTPEAHDLAERLGEWHDSAVLHRRRALARRGTDECSIECPCRDAADFWAEAQRVFGPGAERLAFLRAVASDAAARPGA